jgi:hypothetical protein
VPALPPISEVYTPLFFSNLFPASRDRRYYIDRNALLIPEAKPKNHKTCPTWAWRGRIKNSTVFRNGLSGRRLFPDRFLAERAGIAGAADGAAIRRRARYTDYPGLFPGRAISKGID